MHYAFEYIGKPYKRGATGPDFYDCWGLARALLKTLHGVDMPLVSVGSYSNYSAVRELAAHHGWARVTDVPAEGDALLMHNAFGRHIAVCIIANGRPAYIHADEQAGVTVLHRLSDFATLGYNTIEVWRYASRK